MTQRALQATGLRTPHIPVRLPLPEGLAILQSLGSPVDGSDGSERWIKVDTPLFSVAIYPSGERVRSVWYDDPTGRESARGKEAKVRRYLERYGPLSNWELRLDNGWMNYWFNPTDKAAMVYGIHKDVIRFNEYEQLHA
jgi:hypothetical protein